MTDLDNVEDGDASSAAGDVSIVSGSTMCGSSGAVMLEVDAAHAAQLAR